MLLFYVTISVKDMEWWIYIINEEKLKLTIRMKYSCVQLLNFPDEILMIIFKKLDNIEVLYSLMNINMRLNQILSDPVFTT